MIRCKISLYLLDVHRTSSKITPHTKAATSDKLAFL